jgi:hypothetical protein
LRWTVDRIGELATGMAVGKHDHRVDEDARRSKYAQVRLALSATQA